MGLINYRTDDRVAIQELLYRYSIFVDTLQIEPLMEVFCEDIIFDESALGPAAGPFHGSEAVRGYFTQSFAVVSGLMHITSNIVIDFVDEDHATGISTLLAEGNVWDGSAQRVRGYFHDKYLFDRGAWKFEKRVLKLMTKVQPLVQPL